MRTQQIRELIQQGVDDENRTGRLAEAVQTVAQQNGRSPNDKEIQGVVKFVRDYIECVPNHLEQWIAAAQHAGLRTEMERVLTQLENYWFKIDDAIPDHFGLMGLMDDAYYSLVSLQGMSDYFQYSTGRSLLKHNLTQINEAVSKLIGEPVASHLDVQARITVGYFPQHTLNQVVAPFGLRFGSSPDPFWGDPSNVNTQLGAMGIDIALAGDPTTPAPPPEK